MKFLFLACSRVLSCFFHAFLKSPFCIPLLGWWMIPFLLGFILFYKVSRVHYVFLSWPNKSYKSFFFSRRVGKVIFAGSIVITSVSFPCFSLSCIEEAIFRPHLDSCCQHFHSNSLSSISHHFSYSPTISSE